MIKKIFFLIVSLVILNASLQAQQSQDTLIENGKVFLIHKVVAGQTLYGLSKAYNITIEDIIKYNPQAENGIKIGEDIKIFLKEEKKTLKQKVKQKETVADTSNKHIHYVEAGETLYGISRKYDIPIPLLQEWNPTLTENLSIGQAILIYRKPTTSTTESDNVAQEIKQGVKKDSYKVYALLPLYTNYLSNMENQKFKYVSDYDAFKSFHFIQFYEGLLLAAEDAGEKGIPIKLHVEDINEQNLNKLEKIIAEGELDDADLIIGPFFPDKFTLVCNYVKDKNIVLVNPFSISFDECNALMYKVTASYQSQAENIGKYITQYYENAQIILVNNQSAEDNQKVQAYKTGFMHVIPDSKKISIKEVNYQKEGMAGIRNAINSGSENFIFPFFKGEINVTNFIQQMYGMQYENVTLFAPSFWKEFDNIETEYFIALKTHYVDQFFVDYSNPNVIRFIDRFREAYEIEPTLDKFAFQGYDITLFFLNALMEYGSNFGCEINEMDLPLLSTSFNFTKKTEHCLENNFVNIYRLKDYQFIDAIVDKETEEVTPTIKPKK